MTKETQNNEWHNHRDTLATGSVVCFCVCCFLFWWFCSGSIFSCCVLFACVCCCMLWVLFFFPCSCCLLCLLSLLVRFVVFFVRWRSVLYVCVFVFTLSLFIIPYFANDHKTNRKRDCRWQCQYSRTSNDEEAATMKQLKSRRQAWRTIERNASNHTLHHCFIIEQLYSTDMYGTDTLVAHVRTVRRTAKSEDNQANHIRMYE